MTTMEDALRIVIAKSPQAASQAMKTTHALHARSPMLQHRYNAVVDAALNDPQAEFTSEDRELLAQYVAAGEKIRETRLQVRVTFAEKQYLRQMASEQNLTLSDYIRQKIGLEVSV